MIKNLPLYYAQFLTWWNVILYLVYIIYSNYYKVPIYITNFIISIIITSGLCGNYITYRYANYIINYLYVKNEFYMYIGNYIIHTIPLISVLYYYKKYINNSIIEDNILKSFIKTIIITIIYVFIYCTLIDINYIYFRLPSHLIVIPAIIVFTISLIYINYIQYNKLL
jgi:hypothetical protein